jgi:tetratricopeptide (TPR) repeat protein
MSYFYSGLIKSKLKKYKEAEADFSKTIELYPQYTNAYIERFKVRKKLNKEKEAYTDYKKAEELTNGDGVKEIPRTKEMAEYLLNIVSLSGSFEDSESLKLVQNQIIQIELTPVYMVTLEPQNHSKTRFYDAFSNEGYFAPIICFTNELTETQYEAALSTIKMLNNDLENKGTKADYYYKRAIIYASIEDYNQAFADFDSCLLENKNYALAYFSRARIRNNLIDFLESINSLKNKISIGKSNQIKQKTTHEEHNLDKVLKDYNQAIKLDPNFTFAYFNRAYIRAVKGNFHPAIDDLTKVIEQQPNFAEAYYNRGLMLIYLKENDLGCADLSRAGELGLSASYNLLKRYCTK